MTKPQARAQRCKGASLSMKNLDILAILGRSKDKVDLATLTFSLSSAPISNHDKLTMSLFGVTSNSITMVNLLDMRYKRDSVMTARAKRVKSTSQASQSNRHGTLLGEYFADWDVDSHKESDHALNEDKHVKQTPLPKNIKPMEITLAIMNRKECWWGTPQHSHEEEPTNTPILCNWKC